MKGFKKLIPLILMILTMILVPLGTRADFGDYSGDSDYGDSDWGDSSWDDDSDYDSDYSGSSVGGIEGVIITCVVIFIVAIINKKTSKSTKNTTTNNTSENHSDLRNVSEYNSIDPNFSAADMTEKISNLYVRFQNCWTAKDIDPLRPYLTDAMFAQMDRQLDGYRQRKETNRVERISVLGVRLLGWKQENGKDVMIARLDTPRKFQDREVHDLRMVTRENYGRSYGNNKGHKRTDLPVLRSARRYQPLGSMRVLQQRPHYGFV